MPNVFHWSEGLSYRHVMETQVQPYGTIRSYLLNEYESKYVIGCQNTSAESRFRDYLDPEFRQIELDGLKRLFSELSLVVKGAPS